MASRKFANSYGRSGFADSSTVPAVGSGNEHSAPHGSGVVGSEHMLAQEQPTQLHFVGVMPLNPSRRSRRTLALILLLKAVLIACAVVLALDS